MDYCIDICWVFDENGVSIDILEDEYYDNEFKRLLDDRE